MRVTTMADVIVALDTVPGLTDKRRAELKRAVSRVAILLDPGGNPAKVPAASRATFNRIAQLTPVDLGCTAPKTVDNLVSLVRTAVTLVGAVSPGRGRIGGTLLADTWAAIVNARPNDPHVKDRKVATRVARWAVTHGLAPDQLPDDTFEQILEWNQQNSWSPDHRQKALAAMRGWNRLVDAGAAGRKIEINLPPPFTRPLADFPASFAEDVRNYEDFLRHPEHWRHRAGCIIAGETRQIDTARSERTISIRIMRIRYLASLLVASGFPIGQIVRINVLAAGDNVTRIMAEFERRSAEKLVRKKAEGIDTERGDEKTSSALTIAKEFRAVICGWCAPKQVVRDKFRQAIKAAEVAEVTYPNGVTVTMRLKAKLGHSAKNKKRLREATADPKVLHHLITTPERVVRSIENERKREQKSASHGTAPTLRQAKRFETAFCVALSLAKPLRCLDLSTLTLAQCTPPMPGARRRRFEFRARKNGRVISIKIEGMLLTLFEAFVADYRPVILGTADDLGFLFVGVDGRAISSNTLGARIKEFVYSETGLRWNAHLFRHFDAWVAKEAGASVSDVADLLAISIQTAKKAYDSDRQEDAQDVLFSGMDALRKGGRNSIRKDGRR